MLPALDGDGQPARALLDAVDRGRGVDGDAVAAELRAHEVAERRIDGAQDVIGLLEERDAQAAAGEGVAVAGTGLRAPLARDAGFDPLGKVEAR
jgi:hypothetical protein